MASSRRSHMAAGPRHSDACEKLQLVSGGSSNGTGREPTVETSLASSLPGLADSTGAQPGWIQKGPHRIAQNQKPGQD